MEVTQLGWLDSQLQSEIERVKDCMVLQALEHNEYLRLRGSVQGMNYARVVIKDLAKKLEADDERDFST